MSFCSTLSSWVAAYAATKVTEGVQPALYRLTPEEASLIGSGGRARRMQAAFTMRATAPHPLEAGGAKHGEDL